MKNGVIKVLIIIKKIESGHAEFNRDCRIDELKRRVQTTKLSLPSCYIQPLMSMIIF